ILPHLQKMPYHAERDLAPVSLAALTPLVLIVHPSLPARHVREFVAIAKARPGQLTYASAGSGGVQHLAGELLKITMKIDLVHVPYKGAGPIMPHLIGGHVAVFSPACRRRCRTSSPAGCARGRFRPQSARRRHRTCRPWRSR